MNKEKKNKVKGICGTLLFHAVLLFLLSLPFMSLSYEDPPSRKGGGSISIAMNFIKQDPPPPEKVTQEVPEESETIENKDVITSKEGEIEVSDTKKVETEKITPTKKKKPPIPPVIELTEEEEAFDKNKDGKLDKEERKNLNEFLENTENPFHNNGNGDENYDGDGEEGEGNGTGKGEGFGDGLDWVNSDNSIDPATLDCDQGKGTGNLTIKIIRSPYGKIVDIDEESFKSTLTGLSFSISKKQKELLNCIKKKYNEAIDKGVKVKIHEKNHLHLLKLDFIN